MSTISANLTSPPDNFSTTLSSGISSSDLTIPLNSVAGLATEGIGVLFTKDANGDVVSGSVEIIHWTGVGGSSLTLTNTGDRGLTGSDSGAQAYSASVTYFEVWVTSYYYKSLRDGAVVEHNTDGTHKFGSVTAKTTPVDADEIPIVDSESSSVLKKLSWSNLKATLLSYFHGAIIGPQGFAMDYKIAPTVASNNLTLTLQHADGTTPSSTRPLAIRIGDTVRTVTAALSVTKNAGTNWCNSGSAELATKEIDYFAYLGYNATDGVVIGFSRIPGANAYGDFSTTTTNEKYAAISTITTAASTDYYENVGRFAATLSAGAGYTWTVPTFTAANLIQRPNYESRWLTWSPVRTVSGGTVPTFTTVDQNKYKVISDNCFLDIQWRNNSGGTAGAGANALEATTPFSNAQFNGDTSIVGNGAMSSTAVCGVSLYNKGSGLLATGFNIYNVTSGAALTGGSFATTSRFMWAQGFYKI